MDKWELSGEWYEMHGNAIVCDGETIAIVDDGYENLASAAPDLLAVCQEIRAHFPHFSEWDLPIGFEDRLNAALAKAGCEPGGVEE